MTVLRGPKVTWHVCISVPDCLWLMTCCSALRLISGWFSWTLPTSCALSHHEAGIAHLHIYFLQLKGRKNKKNSYCYTWAHPISIFSSIRILSFIGRYVCALLLNAKDFWVFFYFISLSPSGRQKHRLLWTQSLKPVKIGMSKRFPQTNHPLILVSLQGKQGT